MKMEGDQMNRVMTVILSARRIIQHLINTETHFVSALCVTLLQILFLFVLIAESKIQGCYGSLISWKVLEFNL